MEHAGPISLPKVGVQHGFTTLDGHRLSVVIRQDGRRYVGVYDPDDPDLCLSSIALDAQDAARLAFLLDPEVSSPP